MAERREVERNETSDGPSGEPSEPRGREATAGSSRAAARAKRPVSERVRAFTASPGERLKRRILGV